MLMDGQTDDGVTGILLAHLKKSADDNKVLKSSSVQSVISFGLIELFTFLPVYLLNKHMPDSNKYIHVYTKSRIKTSKLKERKKGNATGLKPTSFECKEQPLIH